MGDIESLVLEHLRHIRARVDQTADDVAELKLRMRSLEHALLQTRRDILFAEETDAHQQAALDRLAERVTRIERRLELTDTQGP